MSRTLSQAAADLGSPESLAFGAQRRVGVLALVLLLSALPGCKGEPTPEEIEAERAAAREAFTWPDGDLPTVTFIIEGFGEVEAELYPSLAPATVARFQTLIEQGFYDGTSFHRVIPGFMVQGGDPNSRNRDPDDDGFGGSGERLADEFSAAPHVRGALSLANSGRKDSGDSQFFFVVQDSFQLDGRYTLFGRIRRGLEVLDAIAAVETDKVGRWGPIDRPIEKVVLRDIRLANAPSLRDDERVALEEGDSRSAAQGGR